MAETASYAFCIKKKQNQGVFSETRSKSRHKTVKENEAETFRNLLEDNSRKINFFSVINYHRRL
jgi:hypothetical protein